ncbi:unnamed protein product [Vitrella brassicaformis CCMP3155]|uniref:Fungal lipase-type domain-containing protein n=2 Tax=Vitrella brassicaformis TaxID=1169539 RepID=A0A0G4FWI8_VITBC|nr:unnamed protein product [Vitrella brassicaformis CCMP3155]|mmetsp:Transcript_15583/g.44558  ORF Transcript_15583/g.44558 Transcript_15583/m.44558 type:complete len:515 (+) Transcript_15583:86-1630(+)|eukprot:CEM19280.1 unnamed protein product [Vitrella brassicaformis CCMP3155]
MSEGVRLRPFAPFRKLRVRLLAFKKPLLLRSTSRSPRAAGVALSLGGFRHWVISLRRLQLGRAIGVLFKALRRVTSSRVARALCGVTVAILLSRHQVVSGRAKERDPRPEHVCHHTRTGGGRGEPYGYQSVDLQMACLARGAIHESSGDAWGWTVHSVIKENDDVGVVSVKPSLAQCAIAFKGTHEWDDWRNDFRMHPLQNLTARDGNVYGVHYGFYKEYETIKSSPSWSTWTALLASPQCSGGIFITGHSLGGAIASLHKLEHFGEAAEGAVVYSFAAPRPTREGFNDCNGFRYYLQSYAGMGSDPVPGFPRSLQHGHTGVLLLRGLFGWSRVVTGCGDQGGGGIGLHQHRMRKYIFHIWKTDDPHAQMELSESQQHHTDAELPATVATFDHDGTQRVPASRLRHKVFFVEWVMSASHYYFKRQRRQHTDCPLGLPHDPPCRGRHKKNSSNNKTNLRTKPTANSTVTVSMSVPVAPNVEPGAANVAVGDDGTLIAAGRGDGRARRDSRHGDEL